MYLDVIEKLPLEEIGSGADDTGYKQLNGLSLAYIGDAVYELLVRQLVLSRSEARVQDMHAACVKYVNAAFQAEAAQMLWDKLTAEEQVFYKRGRNAHSAHTPKNKSEAQYHKSTGFEALIGYLYLKKDYPRLREIFSMIFSAFPD